MTPEGLHARYSNRIHRHIRRVMGGDTEREDIAHEVLLVMLRKSDTVRDPAAMDAWVAQVTRNTLRYVMRRRRLRRHISFEALPETDVALSLPSGDARDLASRAVRVLDRLPEKDRKLLMAYWFTPATADAIADQTRCSVMTVRRRIKRARARFEKLARRDPALASRLADSRVWARSWRRSTRE